MFRYRHNRERKGKQPLVVVAVLMILLVVGGGIAAERVYSSNLKPVSSSDSSQIITIKSGSTAQQIADLLESKKVIRKSWAFQWYIRNNGLRDKLQAGTYALKPNQSVQEIAEILTEGRIDTTLVTILPGKRLSEIRDDLINDGFDVAAVDKALDPSLYAGHPALVDKPAEASLEGYLYPETFQRSVETQPTAIIKLSLDEMQKRLTPAVRAGIVAQGLTVHQGVILASIIEQEVHKPDDKPKVAQVFLKRLKTGMPLGSDVTARYGALKDEIELPENAAQAVNIAIGHDSPYNTRKYSGLPPGPISNVDADALKAVANPATTDFLYFVAGDDGVTYFSKTLDEHNAAANEHCKALCGR